MRTDEERIEDILESITKINKYSSKGKDEFYNNELIQNWIIHHIQLIGEAAARLSEAFRESNPSIPWSKIIGIRNILVHGYFEIDKDIVWNAVETELPDLSEKLNKLQPL